jgi:hypothetical protein
LWNGAFDYSRGIFYEPFFYGQAYNYMLESLVAAPLLWLNIPVYIALPLVTTSISLVPFVTLALFFRKREYYFWAYLCLAFPVVLPLGYNILTTISRGVVQAHLFVPLLFIPLFHPKKPASVTILYLASAICFIANQSAALIILPIFLIVFSHHINSRAFYLKSFLVVPFLLLDYLAKHFYTLHPERVLHHPSGLTLDFNTFIHNIQDINMFGNLSPFFSGWGFLYPLLLAFLLGITVLKSLKREFLFIAVALTILLVSLAVPRIHVSYPNAGLFFTPDRLYLHLPILLVVSLFLAIRKL